MRRVRLSRWTLAIATTGSALCAAEFTLRSLRPESVETAMLSLFTSDPTTSFALRPGFAAHLPDGSNVVINEEGLRDDPLVSPKSRGTTRVLCLGDSFTFGLGVDADDSFPQVCERTLQEMGVLGIEVVNCGVPAWGTDESRRFLEAKGSSFEPDAVVLGVFIANDTFDDLASGEFTVVEGLLVAAERPGALPWDHDLDRFALWQLGKQIGGSLLGSSSAAIATTGGAKRRTFAEMLEVYRCVERMDSDSVEGRRRVVANVTAIHEFLVARNIPFGVVLLPALSEVDDSAFEQALAREQLARGDFDPNAAARRMRVELDRLGIPCLDVAPRFRETTNGDGRKLYLRNYHLNRKGNTIVGRQLAIFLRDQLAIFPKR